MDAEPPQSGLLKQDSDDLLLRQVEQALSMTREERFRAGGELFEFACDAARAGIRAALGKADPDIVEDRLRDRLQLQGLLEKKAPQ